MEAMTPVTRSGGEKDHLLQRASAPGTTQDTQMLGCANQTGLPKGQALPRRLLPASQTFAFSCYQVRPGKGTPETLTCSRSGQPLPGQGVLYQPQCWRFS